MDNSILMQKQVRDNSEDLRAYLKDLGKWEEEMKRKESELTDLPKAPIPRKNKKAKNEKKSVSKGPERIKGYDYAAWDKFDVEAECEKVDEEKSDSEEEPSEEYLTRLRDEANFEKEKGNQFVKNKKWDEAIACYTHSIACYAKDPIYYANRALCFLKKNDLKNAESDCTSALLLEPRYVKALQRRAVAREGLKQYQEALDDLRFVVELEPHNKESKNELVKLQKRLGVYKEEPAKETSEVSKNVTKPKPSTTSSSPSTSKIIEIKQEKNKTEIKQQPQSSPTVVKKIPWPERKDSEIIIPIKKSPHQRSKQSLKNIEIIESFDNDPDFLPPTKKQPETKEMIDLSINYDDNNILADILAQTKQLNVDELLNDFEKGTTTIVKSKSEDQLNTKSDQRKMEKNIGDSIEIFNLAIPKSCVQFLSDWKKIAQNEYQKFLYLKQIDPNELPNIFQQSMESNIFSDIINVLSDCFIKNNVRTFDYLKALSTLKRFSTLTMFMSTQDKNGVKLLLDYYKNTNEASVEEIEKLRMKYELK